MGDCEASLEAGLLGGRTAGTSSISTGDMVSFVAFQNAYFNPVIGITQCACGENLVLVVSWESGSVGVWPLSIVPSLPVLSVRVREVFDGLGVHLNRVSFLGVERDFVPPLLVRFAPIREVLVQVIDVFKYIAVHVARDADKVDEGEVDDVFA